jgi:ceramide glucosyltransferase
MHSASSLVAVICAALALAGVAYFAIAVYAATRFLSDSTQVFPNSRTPPVSILRPLKGLDPHMYAAFCSLCLLEYDEYEVLFGVRDLNDPSIALVEKLREEFPFRQLRLLHCPQALGLNDKVSTLLQMLPQAKYEHVIINDSDILVPRDYLRRVMSILAKPGVGMVTTLYRGLAGATLGSKLEAVGLSTEFACGVLVARTLEGIRFGLGATIATTRSLLLEIGGLAPILDCLGDDYEIGARIAAAGHKVELAQVVVETALPDYRFRDFWTHQLRWARNVKDRRPAQYFGLIVSFALIWAVLAALAHPHAWWTWLVLTVTVAARLTAALVVGRCVLRDPQLPRDLWLLPLRDLLALSVWLVSYLGDEVEWRGERFKVSDGRLSRI